MKARASHIFQRNNQTCERTTYDSKYCAHMFNENVIIFENANQTKRQNFQREHDSFEQTNHTSEENNHICYRMRYNL